MIGLFARRDDQGDETHVSPRWQREQDRRDLRAGWDGPVWRVGRDPRPFWDRRASPRLVAPRRSTA